jgi:multidrug/hemolysin transport system ATP-binding protein
VAAILTADKLCKSFNNVTAVDCVSFSCNRGDLFSFIGPNGAGKSTTINILIGLIAPDSGSVYYGEGVNAEKIGVVFQNNICDDLLTVRENLLTYGSQYFNTKEKLFNHYRELKELLQIGEYENKKFKLLSGGQKRKVEIARALFHKPEILFMDEPTTGLDPKTRTEIWGIIKRLRAEKNLTIFLTTHYMEETAESDTVAVINRGRIVATDTPQKLKSRYSFDRLFITPNNPETLKKFLVKEKLQFSVVADTFVTVTNGDKHAIEIIEKIKINILHFEFKKGTMDDVFLNIIGEVQE